MFVQLICETDTRKTQHAMTSEKRMSPKARVVNPCKGKPAKLLFILRDIFQENTRLTKRVICTCRCLKSAAYRRSKCVTFPEDCLG